MLLQAYDSGQASGRFVHFCGPSLAASARVSDRLKLGAQNEADLSYFVIFEEHVQINEKANCIVMNSWLPEVLCNLLSHCRTFLRMSPLLYVQFSSGTG